MEGTVPSYLKEYKHEDKKKKQTTHETAGARAAQASMVGDKTVITEAQQLEYREFRHGEGGCQKPFSPPLNLSV